MYYSSCFTVFHLSWEGGVCRERNTHDKRGINVYSFRNSAADLLPGHVQSLILLLVKLLNGLQDFSFVVLHNPLLLHQVVVLGGERDLYESVKGSVSNLSYRSSL